MINSWRRGRTNLELSMMKGLHQAQIRRNSKNSNKITRRRNRPSPNLRRKSFNLYCGNSLFVSILSAWIVRLLIKIGIIAKGMYKSCGKIGRTNKKNCSERILVTS
jgi:hypothetical protein